ncbi:cytochrome P450 [Daedaleopsis nitida]|nr:cytochrome P450 [Daedaleopsis nitida]
MSVFIAGAICAPVLWLVYSKLAAVYSSPLCLLPGPPSPSRLYGHVRQVCRAGSGPVTQQWLKEYGTTLFVRWLLMVPALWTADTRTINHILHSSKYGKPWESRISAARIVGDSIIVAEGNAHKKQRRILIRELSCIFLEKAAELRDVWAYQPAQQGDSQSVNVVDGLKKMTLDVIGLAGFDYQLNALNSAGDSNELNQAFSQIFSATPPVSIFRIIMDHLPSLDWFPDTRMKTVEQAHVVMRRIGTQLIEDKKRAILNDASDKSGGVEKRNVHGRDLLTLLIKANMATDIPPEQRLSDEEVFSQIPTFLVAGHETTSTATSWCLFALTQAPHVQRKLRDELLAVSTDIPTMDELAALPYLDLVVRETLRLYTPVTWTLRVAFEDDVLPVSKPFVDRLGRTQTELRIAKGDRVIIPIMAIHHSPEIWGDDAQAFKPERWEHPPEALADIPGVWSHMLAFSGGPRACIGYRFALIELKALVFTLVRAFEFELATAPTT